MKNEFKLIYTGILKFGFKNSKKISIVGLLEYIEKHKLKTKIGIEPEIILNRKYQSGINDFFWELSWRSSLERGFKYLIIYFDDDGCHYQKLYYYDCIDEGLINSYKKFLGLFRWFNEKTNS